MNDSCRPRQWLVGVLFAASVCNSLSGRPTVQCAATDIVVIKNDVVESAVPLRTVVQLVVAAALRTAGGHNFRREEPKHFVFSAPIYYCAPNSYSYYKEGTDHHCEYVETQLFRNC